MCDMLTCGWQVDESTRMRFNVGDAVKCIVSTGWESGKVLKTWDDGNAYRVKLDKGPEVR